MPSAGTVPWSSSKVQLWIEVYFLKTGVNNATIAATIAAILAGGGALTAATLVPLLFDKVEFEVVQFMSDFGLNDIPSASALIPLGRKADNVAQLSTIHCRLGQMKLLLPVKVWARAAGLSGSPLTEAWPCAPFVVFDGYAVSSSFRKTAHGADFTINMTHWLADLAFSASVSRAVHPLSAAQLSYWSSVPLSNVSAGGAGNRSMTGVTPASQFMDALTLTEDFWSGPPAAASVGGVVGGLRLFFRQLALTDHLAHLPVPINGLATSLSPNYDALRAIERFEPFSSEGGYKWGRPLAMSLAVAAAGDISRSIAQDISFLTFDNMAGYTFWDKILEMTSDYQFAVVPMVDRALIVPFQPGLRGGLRRYITADQYDHFETQTQIPRPLRGVLVYLGRPGSQTGADGQGNTPLGDSFQGAFYDAAPSDINMARGTIMFKEAPRWLAGVVPLFEYPNPTQLFANAIVPGLANVTGGPAAIQAAITVGQPSAIYQRLNPVLRGYAQSAYAYEVLRGRQGILSGKLRFDVGPGSTVRIEGSDDIALRESPVDTAETMYATAIRVVTAINAETGGATTSFHLAFGRNENENTVDRTSVAGHPLWNKPGTSWYGCPLLDHPAFT